MAWKVSRISVHPAHRGTGLVQHYLPKSIDPRGSGASPASPSTRWSSAACRRCTPGWDSGADQLAEPGQATVRGDHVPAVPIRRAAGADSAGTGTASPNTSAVICWFLTGDRLVTGRRCRPAAHRWPTPRGPHGCSASQARCWPAWTLSRQRPRPPGVVEPFATGGRQPSGSPDATGPAADTLAVWRPAPGRELPIAELEISEGAEMTAQLTAPADRSTLRAPFRQSRPDRRPTTPAPVRSTSGRTPFPPMSCRPARLAGGGRRSPSEFPVRDAGRQDNLRCAGQLIPLPAGRYDWIYLLAAAERRTEDLLRLHYADGSVDQEWLRVSDFWPQTAGPVRRGRGLPMLLRCTTRGIQRGMDPAIWRHRVPVPRHADLAAVRLPDNPAAHIFAMTLLPAQAPTMHGSGVTGDELLLDGVRPWRHDLAGCLHACAATLLGSAGLDPLEVLGARLAVRTTGPATTGRGVLLPLPGRQLAAGRAGPVPPGQLALAPAGLGRAGLAAGPPATDRRPAGGGRGGQLRAAVPAGLLRMCTPTTWSWCYGFDDERGTVTVLDAIPPFFHGEIPLSVLTAARDSGNQVRHERDMFFADNPIGNRWLELMIGEAGPASPPAGYLARNVKQFQASSYATAELPGPGRPAAVPAGSGAPAGRRRERRRRAVRGGRSGAGQHRGARRLAGRDRPPAAAAGLAGTGPPGQPAGSSLDGDQDLRSAEPDRRRPVDASAGCAGWPTGSPAAGRRVGDLTAWPMPRRLAAG